MWPRRRRRCRSTSSTGSSATPRRTATPTSAFSAASRFCIPQLLDLFAAHPDCYFQVFTNGQLITDDIARAAGAARQRHAAPQHRRLGDRQRRAPRPDAGADQDARGSRGLPPPRAAHRRRHERLPDQHRAGVRSLAAPADRDGRALRVVPHLPRRRAEAQSAARAQAGTGAGGPPLHRADARAAADRDRRCLLGRSRRGAVPDGDRRQPSHRTRRAHRALPGHSVRDQHRPRRRRRSTRR